MSEHVTSELSLRALGAAADPMVWRRLAACPAARPMVVRVRENAAALRATPLAQLPAELYRTFDSTGDRATFEGPYFARRTRLATLALDALLKPDSEVSHLTATIEAICDETQWALPAHIRQPDGTPIASPALVVDLFAAETGCSLTEITTLLSHRLPPSTCLRARREAMRRVIEPFEARSWWWEDAPTNWASVCAGSVALTALQICSASRVARLLPRIRAALSRFLDGYGEDGACAEGFGYWTYGYGYYLCATEALSEALGHQAGIRTGSRAAAAARWPQSAYLSEDVVTSFGDTTVRSRVLTGLLARAAQRFDGVELPPPVTTDVDVVDDCGRWALALRALCWHPAATGEHPSSRPNSHGANRDTWFESVQWLIVPQREGGSPIGFAARGGGNDDPHNHNDLGSLIVAKDGEVLLSDPGRGVYDAQYFGPQRWDNPAAGSHGHSVPLLDGLRQAPGAQARARVLQRDSTAGGELLELDLTEAYPHPQLRSLVRRFDLVGAHLEITDRLRAAAPIQLTQRFISLLEPEPVAAGEVVIAARRNQASLRYPSDASLTVGRFPVGRGSFPQPVYYIDIMPPDPSSDISATVRIDAIPKEHHDIVV